MNIFLFIDELSVDLPAVLSLVPAHLCPLLQPLLVTSNCYDTSCVQVPCFVFDTDGKKHDLSPLIKMKEGYLVDDGNDDVDFYINICRSLGWWRGWARDDDDDDGWMNTSLGHWSLCNEDRADHVL